MGVELTATEIARNLAEYLNRVAYKGESFVITRGNKAIAELRPFRPTGTARDLAELIQTLNEWDPEEREGFARDLEEAQRFGNQPMRDPWEEHSTQAS